MHHLIPNTVLTRMLKPGGQARKAANRHRPGRLGSRRALAAGSTWALLTAIVGVGEMAAEEVTRTVTLRQVRWSITPADQVDEPTGTIESSSGTVSTQRIFTSPNAIWNSVSGSATFSFPPTFDILIDLESSVTRVASPVHVPKITGKGTWTQTTDPPRYWDYRVAIQGLNTLLDPSDGVKREGSRDASFSLQASWSGTTFELFGGDETRLPSNGSPLGLPYRYLTEYFVVKIDPGLEIRLSPIYEVPEEPDELRLERLDQKIAFPETTLKVTGQATGADDSVRLSFLMPDGTVDGSLTVNGTVDTGTGFEAFLTVAKDALPGPRTARLSSSGQTSDLANALAIVGMKSSVSQGARPGDDVELVANHPTVVRCHPEVSEDQGLLSGVLYVFEGDEQVPGSPFPPALPIPSSSDDASYVLMKASHTEAAKYFLEDSLNFYFGHSGQGSGPPLGAGNYEFWLAVDPLEPETRTNRLIDSNRSRDDLVAERDFMVKAVVPLQTVHPTGALRLWVWRDHLPAIGLSGRREVLQGLPPAFDYVRAAFPIDNQRLYHEVADMPEDFDVADFAPPWLGRFTTTAGDYVMAYLESWLADWNRNVPSSEKFDHVVLATSKEMMTNSYEGEGTLGVSNLSKAIIVGSYPATLTHELGHNLGLGDSYPGGYTSPVNPRRPDANHRGNLVEDGAVRLVPLYTSNFVVPRPLHSVTASVTDAGEVLVPGAGFRPLQRMSIMSNANDDNDRWPDLIEWQHLRSQLRPGVIARSQTGQHLAMRGILAIDDSVSVIDTALEDDPIADGQRGDWRYVLELLDAGGEVLSEREFGVGFFASDVGFKSVSGFSVSTPWDTEGTMVRLRRDQKTIWERELSQGAPEITIVEPSGGALPAGPVTVRWIASDPDGDPLTYSLFYLREDGTSVPLAVEVRDTSWEWPAENAGGTQSGRLVVVASDGFLEDRAESAVFSRPDQLAQVLFTSPENGASFPAGQPFVLRGTGVDPETGLLSDEAFSFHSDLEGDLGSGSPLIRSLQEGTHRLTVKATDPSGSSAEANIEVTIGPADEVPLIEVITPDAVTPLGEITLHGRNLDAEGLEILFGETSGRLLSVSETEAVVEVPAELAPGELPVRAMAGAFRSSPQTLTILAGYPRMVSHTPVAAPAGTPVWVRLSGIDPADAIAVRFGAMSASVLATEPGRLLTSVPAGLAPGRVALTIGEGDRLGESADFEVTAGEPLSLVKLDAVVPASGAAGETVSLHGSGFPETATDLAVFVDEEAATILELTEATVRVELPPGVDSSGAQIWITVRGMPSNALAFNQTGDTSAFEAWRMAQFGDSLDDPEIAGHDADPDGDGRNNLLEFLERTLPLHEDRPRPREATVLDTGDEHQFAFTFSINADAPAEFAFSIEASSTLEGDWETLAQQTEGSPSWMPIVPGIEIDETAVADGLLEISMHEPLGEPKPTRRFVRWRAHQTLPH